MSDDLNRREVDKGVVGVAKATSRTFWTWYQTYHIDALAVIGVTLWLTIRVIEWSMDFADTHYDVEGWQIPGIIGAVLGPWGIMQAAMFAFYVNLLARNGAGK